MMSDARTTSRLLAALALAAGLAPGCGLDDGDRYLGPGGVGDPAGGGSLPGGRDAGVEGDGGAPVECAAGEVFCAEGGRWRCSEDGGAAVLVQDCAAAPTERCVTGACAAGDAPESACCVADEPFCRAQVEVEGKDGLEVEYRGLWDDDFACSGSVRDDGYNWSFWPRIAACEGRFVRVIVSGYREGWEPGATYPLCRTSTSEPAVHVTLMADAAAYGNLDEACELVTGTISFDEYGLEPGAPFGVRIDGRLLDPTTGETRSLQVTSTGLLGAFE